MPSRRFSLEPLTLPDVGARELIDIAARTGFDYLGMVLHQPSPEMPVDPIVRDLSQRREAAAAMKAQGVELCTIECFNLTPDSNPKDFSAGLACGHELGARNATAIVWENSNRADVLAKLGRLCDMARELDIRVNVEFFAFCQSIRCLDDAIALVRDSGRENIGIQMDILHLMRTGSTIDDIRRLDPALIGATQISDGPLVTAPKKLHEEAGGNRAIPGEGEFPIKAFLDIVPPGIAVGIEVPQVALIGKVAPEERARRLLTATRRLLESRA
jgi:sugar phosphate isomerase/epimerase